MKAGAVTPMLATGTGVSPTRVDALGCVPCWRTVGHWAPGLPALSTSSPSTRPCKGRACALISNVSSVHHCMQTEHGSSPHGYPFLDEFKLPMRRASVRGRVDVADVMREVSGRSRGRVLSNERAWLACGRLAAAAAR